ncbi:hypothetical protein [Falsiroseomonas sp. CW058]|uniref:hypothetical protein n=1 Tax=Falsiroseomonas sp. CW058 TaxID=3388664 RepID=UPI003D312DFF
MPRLAACFALLLLGACTNPVNTGFSGFSGFGAQASPPPPVAARGERDPRLDACRDQATRAVQWRDRGQLMRTDETESGRGTTTVAPFSRTESDRMGAQMERDRLIAECMRNANPVAPQALAQPAAAGGAGRR